MQCASLPSRWDWNNTEDTHVHGTGLVRATSRITGWKKSQPEAWPCSLLSELASHPVVFKASACQMLYPKPACLWVWSADPELRA